MSEKKINVKILRFNPKTDKEPYYQTYIIPFVEGLSVLDVLDYIYDHLDGSLAYYGHASCRRGVCGRCILLINEKISLACQTLVSSEELTIKPPPKFKVIRDLMCKS